MSDRQAVFNSSLCTLHSSFSIVSAFDSRPLKYICVAARDLGVGEAAHDALAARAVVLQRVPVRGSIIEAELCDDLFQIVEPHLPDELRAATWADSLRRFKIGRAHV